MGGVEADAAAAALRDLAQRGLLARGAPDVRAVSAAILTWLQETRPAALDAAIGIDRARLGAANTRHRDKTLRALAALPPFAEMPPRQRAEALANAWRSSLAGNPVDLPDEAEKLLTKLCRMSLAPLTSRATLGIISESSGTPNA